MTGSLYRVASPFELDGRKYETGDDFDPPSGWSRTASERTQTEFAGLGFKYELLNRNSGEMEVRIISLPLEVAL